MPYLSGPLSYLSPYASQADSVGASTLERLDAKMPVLQQPTDELLQKVRGAGGAPLRLSAEAQQYVARVYEAEFKRTGGNGLLAYGRAMIATGLVVSADGLTWATEILSKKGQTAKETVNEKARQAQAGGR
jgi:hypothetical protein